MTDDKRQFYDKIFMWSRLSMTQDEYDDWFYKVSWPCSPEHPDGMFDNIKEFKEYFKIE